MQPDRRHALETNDLADSASAAVERLRPHLRTIGLAAVAVALGFAAWSLVQSRREAAREESWAAFFAALDDARPEALDTMAGYHQGTIAATWARLMMADRLLGGGSQALFVDREQARRLLEDAASRYAAVLAANPPAAAAERATLGLAKARESLGGLDATQQGDEVLKNARDGYEAIVDDFPGSAMKPFAAARGAALDRESTRQWYDWFAQYKPAPPTDADGAAASSESPAGAAAGGAAESAESGAAEPTKPVEPTEPADESGGDAAPDAGPGTDAPR